MSEQNLRDAYNAQNTFNSEFNTYKQQCRADIQSLDSQIEDSNAAMSKALEELKESPAYKTLSDTWNNLQKQLRELSSD